LIFQQGFHWRAISAASGNGSEWLWIAYPSHDELVNALDAYRSRSYWEVVKTQDEQISPSTLEWMIIKPKHK